MSSRLLLQRLAPRVLAAQQQMIGAGAMTTTTAATATASSSRTTTTMTFPTLVQFRRSFAAAAIKSPPGGADDASVPAADDDTHADFRPSYAPPSSPESVRSSIERDIKTHDVFLYMKGDPEAPQCGFSNMACRILDAYGVSYGSRNVLADPALREGVKEFSAWPTIPQCYVKGEFVGGADILMSMHQSGELEKVLGELGKK